MRKLFSGGGKMIISIYIYIQCILCKENVSPKVNICCIIIITSAISKASQNLTLTTKYESDLII